MKRCKQCGKEFEGRRNQEYCCIKCKSLFNNEKAAVIRAKLSDNRILQRNFNILTQAYSQYRNKPILLSILMEKGFDAKAPFREAKTLAHGYIVRMSNGIGYRFMEENGKKYAILYLEGDLKFQ
jgi:hypothetical protein